MQKSRITQMSWCNTQLDVVIDAELELAAESQIYVHLMCKSIRALGHWSDRVCVYKWPEDAAVRPRSMTLCSDLFFCLATAVRGALVAAPIDLAALANNLIVVEILQAVRISGRQGELYLK
jgi:hypothetical protein